jgi:hypothetical protein
VIFSNKLIAMIISDRFLPLIGTHSLDEFDRQESTIIGTWPDLTLALMNDGWSKFASENGGNVDRWCLGSCLLDAIPAILLPFYRNHFEAVLRENRPWEHTYECSSPDLLRLFHMIVFPIQAGLGLLIVHSLRQESSHDPSTNACPIDEYKATDGFIHQCVHCRRVRRGDDRNAWDWLPELVRAPRPNTSHGLCQPCFEFYYNEGREFFPTTISTVDLSGRTETTNSENRKNDPTR